MIDIVVMLFTIIRSYFPSELRWTAVLTVSLAPHQLIRVKPVPVMAGSIWTPQHSNAKSTLLCCDMQVFDNFSYMFCMVPVLYCIYYSLR